MTRPGGALAHIPTPAGNAALAPSSAPATRRADVLAFPRDSTRRAADKRSEARAAASDGPQGGRLGAALAVSTALHLALVAAALHFGDMDAGFAAPGRSLPLEVTLSLPAGSGVDAMPPAPVATLASPSTTLPAPATTLSTPAANRRDRQSQSLAKPRPAPGSSLPSPPSQTELRGTDAGRVSINVADASEPADPSLLAPLLALHPRATRIVPEFAIAPSGVYPLAAIAERRQQQLRVAVLVHDDGRIELPPGMLDDPVFAPSVHAALAGARAVPLRSAGEPSTGWALLVFSYEFVGAR